MRRYSVLCFLTHTAGATSIEYALIAAFLSIMIVGGATAIGTKLSANYYSPIGVAFN